MINEKKQKSTREIVKGIFREHPDWNARQIYDRYKNLIVNFKKPVTLNAVQKHVEGLRRNYRIVQEEGLDNPWSIGTCEKYGIRPDIIPVLIKEQQLRLDTNIGPGNLTIRGAIWIDRLYSALHQIAIRLFPHESPGIWQSMVSLASREYSSREQLSAITRDSFDTKDLDYWFFIKEDPEIWESLRGWSKILSNEKRDCRFIGKEEEPAKIDGFLSYYEDVKIKKEAQK